MGINQVLTLHDRMSASLPKEMVSVPVGDDEGCGKYKAGGKGPPKEKMNVCGGFRHPLRG
jgi:hypothetical protein